MGWTPFPLIFISYRGDAVPSATAGGKHRAGKIHRVELVVRKLPAVQEFRTFVCGSTASRMRQTLSPLGSARSSGSLVSGR